MEIIDNNGFVDCLAKCIPWFATALACFGSGHGFYHPLLPQLKDQNGKIISNYINVDYECEEFVVRAKEVTQSSYQILEILFSINLTRQEIEERFFKRQPDAIVSYSYSLDQKDKIGNDSRIWTYPKYSISLSDRKEGCKVSISRRAKK